MTQDIGQKLKDELAKIDMPEGISLDVLTSQTIIDKILPVITALTKVQVEENQKVKDATGEKLRLLAEKIIIAPTGNTDIGRFVSDVSNGIMDLSWIEKEIGSLNDHWLWGPIMGIVIGGIHIGTTLLNYVQVSQEKTKQIAAEDIRPFLLDLNTLMSEYFRHPNNYAFVIEQMRKMGISEQKIDVFIDNAKTFPDVGVLARLLHREILTDEGFSTYMKNLRYTEEDIALIKPALLQYPGISDLVRMAVREVFSPELASSLGLFSDMPYEFIEEAKKAGLPEEYAQMYWGAHWVPPSLTNAFAMFHRGVIDDNELNDLLRINDYMPNYRDKLKEIAYNVITRVDLRRIYNDGFITYEEMREYLLKQGSNPEDADMLADWIDARYGEDRKEIAKGDILKLYKLGAYNRTETAESLKSLRYTDYAVDDMILTIDIQRAEKTKQNLIKIMKKAYRKAELSRSEIEGKLVSVGVSRQEISDIFAEWDTEIKAVVKFLRVQDVEKIFKNGIWREDETEDYSNKIGYNTKDSGALMMLWTVNNEE